MKKLIAPFVVLLFVMFVVLAQNSGVRYTISKPEYSLMDTDVFFELKSETVSAEGENVPCLILTDSRDEVSSRVLKNAKYMLEHLHEGFDVIDISKDEMPPLEWYETLIVTYKQMNDDVFKICDWVRYDGGRVLFAVAFDWSTTLNAVMPKFGIINQELDYGPQETLRIVSDFMPGAEGKTFSEAILDNSALRIRIGDDCTLHVRTNDEAALPILWERDYGEGRFVINNSDILIDREARGYFASAYSLLRDAFAYPVVNGSAFFIDDWPAPIVQGYDERLYSQYGTSIYDFYTNVWWPDMETLIEKYGVRFTGLLVETYSDETSAPYEPVTSTSEYTYAGAMLLNHGCEIGYHGYNHMPLCLESFDYLGKLDYEKYPTDEDMEAALRELEHFGAEVFPDNDFLTYVPPSNVLSGEGRAMIAEKFPEIRIISGIYTSVDYEFEQDFDVSDDGIINVPRAVSGCMIDEFMEWVSTNLMAFQYVNSHFLHPDDVLDVDRGAELGWENMYATLEAYVQDMSEIAGLRNVTASELGAAVQRYDCLGVDISSTDDEIKIKLTGFYDEAWLLVRVRNGKPGAVSGGELVKVESELYLLRAVKPEVTIAVKGD